MLSEEIPQWAVERACDLLLDEGPGAQSNEAVNAFARYIAAHEQPPVDPDVIAVREILTAVTGESTVWVARAITPEEVLCGDLDESPVFAEALTAYRKHKEAGK